MSLRLKMTVDGLMGMGRAYVQAFLAMVRNSVVNSGGRLGIWLRMLCWVRNLVGTRSGIWLVAQESARKFSQSVSQEIGQEFSGREPTILLVTMDSPFEVVEHQFSFRFVQAMRKWMSKSVSVSNFTPDIFTLRSVHQYVKRISRALRWGLQIHWMQIWRQ